MQKQVRTMGRSNSSTRSGHRSFVTGCASNATLAIYRPDREASWSGGHDHPGDRLPVCLAGGPYYGETRVEREGGGHAALSIEVQLHVGDVGQADRQPGGPPYGRAVVYRVRRRESPRV